MDEADIEIIIGLAQNSRISFRDLAEMLDLSVNAVHKRVQTLQELGILNGFHATVSLSMLRPVLVLITGLSQSTDLDDTVNELGKDPRIFKVIMAGGNMVYVHAVLRDLSELQDTLDFVRKCGQVTNTSFGFLQPSEQEFPPMTTLDFRIVNSLRHDARKAVSDIAEELGVSTKTVRRRLSRLVKEGLISLTIDFVPTASSDIITILHVKISSAEERKRFIPSLWNEYRPNVIGLSYLFDPHDILYCTLWTKNMKDMMSIVERIKDDDRVESVTPNIFYDQRSFETWVDELLEMRAKGR